MGPIEMTGKKFGRLTVLGFSNIDKWRQAVWLCKCDCGKESKVKGSLLRSGKTTSCGCYNREIVSNEKRKHGMAGSNFYQVWNSMVMRCHNPNSSSYGRYGAIGITVDIRWRTFQNFYKDMYSGYREGLTIERIRNNEGYYPSNCRWADRKEQANNTRRNRMFTYNGDNLTMSQMARKYNIDINTFKRRIYRGWKVNEVIEGKKK